MVCTIPDYEVSTRNPVPSGPPGGGITVAVYRLLATIILVSVLTVVACGDSTSQPPEVAEGEIYIIAKDKATGSVVDETKHSDVRQSGICEDLAIESAALNPNLEFHCEARQQGGVGDSADAENSRAATEQSYVVQYNLENGQYSIELVSGDMERCRVF